jgi:hypothetical protein
MKVKPSILVATAMWTSIPNAIITGTVIRDVLPVTTLTALVRKNTAIRMQSLEADTENMIAMTRFRHGVVGPRRWSCSLRNSTALERPSLSQDRGPKILRDDTSDRAASLDGQVKRTDTIYSDWGVT